MTMKKLIILIAIGFAGNLFSQQTPNTVNTCVINLW